MRIDRRVRPAPLATLVAVAVIAAGCGSGDETTSTSAAGGDTTTTAADSGKDVELDGLSGTTEVDAGTDFTIALDGNPSTGYMWVLAEKPDPEVLKYKRFDFESAGKDAPPGSPQKVLLGFAAVGPGEADITLNYVPPGGGEPEGSQTGTIVVK